MIGHDDHVGIGSAAAGGAGDFARVPRDRLKLILGTAGQAAANTDAESLGDGIRRTGVMVRIVQEVDPARFLSVIEPLACGFRHAVGEEIDRRLVSGRRSSAPVARDLVNRILVVRVATCRQAIDVVDCVEPRPSTPDG